MIDTGESPFYLARTKFNQHGPQKQREVAKATDIPISTISAIENGERDPNYRYVAILAKHYGVSADYLCGIDPEPEKDIDVRSISKKLNLSHAAVIGLRFLGREYPPEVTNRLLVDHFALEDILRYIPRMETAVSEMYALLNDPESSLKALDEAWETLRHYRADVLNSFEDMIDMEYGYKDIPERYRKRREEKAYNGLFDEGGQNHDKQ